MTEPTAADIRQMREQGDLTAYIRSQMRAATERDAAQLAAVRRHPDLWQQVEDLGLPQWDGHLPPARDCTGGINNSPLAARLQSLVTEAHSRRTTAERKAA